MIGTRQQRRLGFVPRSPGVRRDRHDGTASLDLALLRSSYAVCMSEGTGKSLGMQIMRVDGERCPAADMPLHRTSGAA